jgi:hypothetical protein
MAISTEAHRSLATVSGQFAAIRLIEIPSMTCPEVSQSDIDGTRAAFKKLTQLAMSDQVSIDLYSPEDSQAGCKLQTRIARPADIKNNLSSLGRLDYELVRETIHERVPTFGQEIGPIRATGVRLYDLWEGQMLTLVFNDKQLFAERRSIGRTLERLTGQLGSCLTWNTYYPDSKVASFGRHTPGIAENMRRVLDQAMSQLVVTLRPGMILPLS